jgi:hypothetical protein
MHQRIGKPENFGSGPMSWIAMLSGIGGAAMLAFGCDMVVPVGAGVGGLCDLAGIASVMVSFGLMDGE